MNDDIHDISYQTGKHDMLCYLTLKNKVDELNKLTAWINNDIPAVFEISESTVFKMDLVLTELIGNIINYAYPTPCESEIKIKCYHLQDNIEINIEDAGIPFNPLEIPDVVLPQTLAEANIGGLGIHLVRRYIYEGNYQRKNNKNIFSMRLKI
jgi:anti-sigma regulatory factor (Ser/Thr protein kinase)